MSDFGGKTKTTTTGGAIVNPQLQSLEGLRLALAQDILGGSRAAPPSQAALFQALRSSKNPVALLRQLAQQQETPQGFMPEFFKRVLIPNTLNTLTAAGLGRSGALGEAVANTQMAYAGDFLKALLTGVPSSQAGTPAQTTTQKFQPGVVDWLGLGLQAAGSLFGRGGIFGD